MLHPARRLLKKLHPEGIPSIGVVFYNAISQTRMFQCHYELIAKNILEYCSEGSILDIGTGPGWLLVKLHQLCPSVRLVGVDVSASMVAKACKNITNAGLGDVIEVKYGKAGHLPFADNSFDMVVSTGSIHHWKEPTAGLKDIYHILKPGGYALMYDIVSDTPASVMEEVTREFGKLSTMLFWVHTYEEPFYSCKDFELLARPTLFVEGQIRFVGVMCCLVLEKKSANIKSKTTKMSP